MINLEPIPEGSVEIQTGLWMHEFTQTIAGRVYLRKNLYSTEGYCFYDVTEPVYDSEGNELPADEILPEQRVYVQQANLGISESLWSVEQINAKYISVPVDPGYTILGNGNDHEIM
jgi:hypothetical protein